MIRIGIVDFDTSHVVEFTRRINHVDIDEAEFVHGGRVVAGFPGDSAIMPERIPGHVAKLESYGVRMLDSLDDLGGEVDAVLIESQQGARHRDRARPFLEAGIPTFIDKPFAENVATADAILALATTHNAPLMSCSSLRYSPEVIEAVALQRNVGRLLTADVWTPSALHDGNPGLLHYGIHGVEMLYTLMGIGCAEVRAVYQPPGEVITGVWNDGRIGVLRGMRAGAYAFGFAAHYEKGHHAVASVRGGAYYTGLVGAILRMFEDRHPPIPYAEMREIMAFIDAASASRDAGGAAITLAS